VSDTTESDANLRVGLFLWDLLTQAGAEVVMTRTFETRLTDDCFSPPNSDSYRANRSEELGIRCRVAEANDCDLMISIHHNAVNNPEVNFATAFYFDPLAYRAAEGEDPPVEHPTEAVELSRRLAESVVENLHERLEIPTRSARHGDFHVLRETSLPVVLSEGSFMTNPDEARRLDNLARARLEAIALFESIVGCLATETPAAGGDE
jgi:N-acetylmuramoyl-L-alanine amidase